MGIPSVGIRGDIGPISVRYRLDPAVVGASRADDGGIKPISARDRADIATKSHRTDSLRTYLSLRSLAQYTLDRNRGT